MLDDAIGKQRPVTLEIMPIWPTQAYTYNTKIKQNEIAIYHLSSNLKYNYLQTLLTSWLGY